MKTDSPKFTKPPVIETVLSAQFARLQSFTAAHAGWFWKKELPDFSQAQETIRLDDVFERFDDEGRWATRAMMTFSSGDKSRMQFTREKDGRMIQLQDSRYILNWKKGSSGYATHGVLKAEFDTGLERFRSFAKAADFGELDFNQWEVTYVNHIPKGELWETLSDWPKIIPSLCIPSAADGVRYETQVAVWNFLIGENKGRLHVVARHGKAEDGKEVLSFDLTARGPVTADMSLRDGLDLGHNAIVWSFVSLTSPLAHSYWGRTS